MNITISTIAHNRQRYDTVGDWFFDEDEEDMSVLVSHMKNEDYEFLVGIHEAVEAYLCKKRGITDEDVTKFDTDFEKKRVEGNTDEPGDSKKAPYRKEHMFATKLERMIAKELKVNWNKYGKTIDSL